MWGQRNPSLLMDYRAFLEHIWHYLVRSRIYIPPNPAILLLGMYFNEDLAWVLKRMCIRRLMTMLFVAVES